jgi:hypothetical protein
MFQFARDLGEETSIRCYNDAIPEFAYLTFFRIYKDQNNLLESLFYCLLYIKTLEKKEVIVRRAANELIQDVFALFRNIGLLSICERFYQTAMRSPTLDEYQRHKWEMMYFNMRMIRRDKDLPQATYDYLYKNLNNVLKYEKSSARPWLTFLINLRSKYKLTKNIDDYLQSATISFKSCMSSDELSWIETVTSNNPELTRKDLIHGILQEKATRQRVDYVNEIQRLLIPAERLIVNSIEENNIDDLLLCFLIKNDSSINFNEQLVPDGSLYPVSVNQFTNVVDDKLGKLQDYYEKELPLCENQMAIWLFESGGNIFYSILNRGRFSQIFSAHGWTEKSTRHWVRNILPKFYFSELDPIRPRGVLHVPNFEDISKEINDNLAFATIPFQEGYELLFICDLFVSTFPLNLIQFCNRQYLSESTTVSNIVNPDLFIARHKAQARLTLPLQISVWAPIVDSDFTISAIHSLILDDLMPFSPTYITDRTPTMPIETQINVFVGHGSRGIDGFKAVYTCDDISIRRPDRLFGSGQIAVLFICHAGSIETSMYTHQLSSLSISLIEMGYQTVLASFWALHMKIPNIWLKSFLFALESGETVSLAAQKANVDIKNIFPVPTAWAAMHLYGNPNLKVETDGRPGNQHNF